MDVIGAKRDRLTKLLSGGQRADALVAALSESCDDASMNLERCHLQLGHAIGIQEKVARCNDRLGTDYDEAIIDLLREEPSWTVEQLDDGKRQNVPDMLLERGKTTLLIECKTVTKRPPLISKDEAFDVLQKSADFEERMKRVTLGKPDFDEHSKKKAAASSLITLIQHLCSAKIRSSVKAQALGREALAQIVASSPPRMPDSARSPGLPRMGRPPGGRAPSVW